MSLYLNYIHSYSKKCIKKFFAKIKKKKFPIFPFFREIVVLFNFQDLSKMKVPKRLITREMIGNFYKLHHSKGKFHTYTNFKASGFSKSQIYTIMANFDQNGSVGRKSGSGRPQKLDKKMKSQLKKMVNDKVGVSQRKLATKFNVNKSTIGRNLKKTELIGKTQF